MMYPGSAASSLAREWVQESLLQTFEEVVVLGRFRGYGAAGGDEMEVLFFSSWVSDLSPVEATSIGSDPSPFKYFLTSNFGGEGSLSGLPSLSPGVV